MSINCSTIISVDWCVHATLCIFHKILRTRKTCSDTYRSMIRRNQKQKLMVWEFSSENLCKDTYNKNLLTKFVCLGSYISSYMSWNFSDSREWRVYQPLIKVLLCYLWSQGFRCCWRTTKSQLTVCQLNKILKKKKKNHMFCV